MFFVQIIFNGVWYDLELVQTEDRARQLIKLFCEDNGCTERAFRVVPKS